jgi:hypothetical protein
MHAKRQSDSQGRHSHETDIEKADANRDESKKSESNVLLDKNLKPRKCIIGSLVCFIIITAISLSVGLSVGLSVRNSKWCVLPPSVSIKRESVANGTQNILIYCSKA